MINVCYAVSDKKGTYTKYAGTSLCSLFENTKEWVTVHFLHDHTLSTDNRRYLMQLVRGYGQQIVFYDVEKANISRWQKLAETTKWLEEVGFMPPVQAAWYRLILGEFLTNLKRVIYLDADTIVNLDISELWHEKVGENGLAAVVDKLVKEDMSSKVLEEKIVDEERYFNAGVLLIDFQKLERQANLLECGLEFIREHEINQHPVQEIMNKYWGHDCCQLPGKYNLLVRYEMMHHNEMVGEGIYHYTGQAYAIDAVNNYNRLFFEFFTKTPWCNADFIGNLARHLHQSNRSLMMGFANLIAGKKRIVIGNEDDKEKLSKMLMLKEKEEYYTIKDFNKRGLQLEPDEILLFFIKPEEFALVKEHLEACGGTEGIHFINGNIFLYRDGGQDARILRES